METIKRNVLLNPGPATTTDTVKYAQVVPDICPREVEFQKMMEEVRQQLVRIVHGDDAYTAVLFCGSGTICMDVCLNSLLPEEGKILVINNGAYSARGVEICEYYGLEHINYELPIDQVPDLEALEQVFVDQSDIKVVYITHHETGTGILNPIREIGALAHKYNATFIVDTTSSYAMIPIDIKKDNIDFCMASAQKGIMAMTGLSYVIGRKDIIEESKNYPKRSYYCNLYQQYYFFKKTGEMHFTPPVQAVYAAKQALQEYFTEGEVEKWNRHQRVMNAIHEGLAELGLEEAISLDKQAGLVASIIYPNHPNWDFGKVHDYCYERGFTIYPGKIAGTSTFRLCALGAIDEVDIKAFFEVLKESLEVIGM